MAGSFALSTAVDAKIGVDAAVVDVLVQLFVSGALTIEQSA